MDTQQPAVQSTRRGFWGGFALIREHWRAYLIAHAAYYTLLIVGLIIVIFNRDLQQTLMEAVGQTFSEGGTFGAVGEAYLTGQVFPAIALTFIINLVIGTFASITLPSLIIPFSGWLVALYRALLWGFIFAPPPNADLSASSLLRGLLLIGLLLLEGEAYIIGMLGAWLQGRAFIFHKRLGYAGPGRGYLAGLKQTAWIYVPAIIVLIIAAVYEVIIAGVLG